MNSTPDSIVISVGQVGHLKVLLEFPLFNFNTLVFPITCPHFNKTGYKFTSFVTGQMNKL